MPANPEIRVEIFKRPKTPPSLNKKRRGPKPGSKRKKDSELHKCTNNCDYFAKGQLISKCPFGVFKSSKKTTKFLKGFLP